MSTGEIIPMKYSGHPELKRKRVSFAVSVENGIYVECYWYNDLMSICNLNGNLLYNITVRYGIPKRQMKIFTSRM